MALKGDQDEVLTEVNLSHYQLSFSVFLNLTSMSTKYLWNVFIF